MIEEKKEDRRKMIPLLAVLALLAVVLSIVVVFRRRQQNNLSYLSVLLNIIALGMLVLSPQSASISLLAWSSLILSVLTVIQFGWDWAGGSLVVVNALLTSYSTWKMLSHHSRTSPQLSPTIFYTPVSSFSSSPWQPPVLLPRSRPVDYSIHPFAGSFLPSISSGPIRSIPSDPSMPSISSIYPSVSYPPTSSSSSSSRTGKTGKTGKTEKTGKAGKAGKVERYPLNPRLAHQLQQLKPIVTELISPEQTDKLTRYVMQCFFPDTPELVERWVDRIQSVDAFLSLFADLASTATPEQQVTIEERLQPEVERFQAMWSATKKIVRGAIKYTLSNGLATPQRRQWAHQRLVSQMSPAVFLKMQRYLMEEAEE